MDPDFVGGPSEYRHAVRFSSPELARRFYAVWMGSGEGLGIPSPHHGCLFLSLYLAVTCSLLLPEECVASVFLGYFRFQRYLGRQWIHDGVSL